MTQREFYKSRAWRRCRDAFIKHRIAQDGGVCQVCQQELGFIVHHKVWLDDTNCNDTSISLNHENLRYECQACHNRERDPRKGTCGRVQFDDEGNIVGL